MYAVIFKRMRENDVPESIKIVSMTAMSVLLSQVRMYKCVHTHIRTYIFIHVHSCVCVCVSMRCIYSEYSQIIIRHSHSCVCMCVCVL
jgi:hypothetical protein